MEDYAVDLPAFPLALLFWRRVLLVFSSGFLPLSLRLPEYANFLGFLVWHPRKSYADRFLVFPRNVLLRVHLRMDSHICLSTANRSLRGLGAVSEMAKNYLHVDAAFFLHLKRVVRSVACRQIHVCMEGSCQSCLGTCCSRYLNLCLPSVVLDPIPFGKEETSSSF